MPKTGLRGRSPSQMLLRKITNTEKKIESWMRALQSKNKIISGTIGLYKNMTTINAS